MKCKYITDKVAGKVLIPGCMAVAVSGDIEDCTCTTPLKKGQNLRERIAELEIENRNLKNKIKRYEKDLHCR